jgi:hypothetical protein
MPPKDTIGLGAGRFYVYLLCRPDGTPFYVGKGTGRRLLRHEIEARGACACHRCRTIRCIWADGAVVERRVVCWTDDEGQAFAREIALIASIGRANLTNQTDGGDGASHVVGDETRAKLRAVLRTAFASPESRARRAEAARRRWADPGVRQEHSRRLRARAATDAAVEKRAAVGRRLWADPEHKAKMVTALQGGRQSEQARRNQAEGTKAAWARRKARMLTNLAVEP